MLRHLSQQPFRVERGGTMNHVCREIALYVRSCEGLLSREGLLTEDERSLLEYYIKELSRELLADKPTVRLRYNATVRTERSPDA